MRWLFIQFFHSFSNNPEGFSARKLSAFGAVVMAVIVTFKFGDHENVEELTITWLAFALLCLGIITVQQIIDFRSGRTTSTEVKTLNKTTVTQ